MHEVDATIMYWTTMIGYYGGGSVDADILRRTRSALDDRYLLIFNTASFDSTALRAGLLGTGMSYFNEVDNELVYVEKSMFDPYEQ
jgi:hypothetical protein